MTVPSPDNAVPDKPAAAAVPPVTPDAPDRKPAASSGKPRVWFKDAKTGERKVRGG